MSPPTAVRIVVVGHDGGAFQQRHNRGRTQSTQALHASMGHDGTYIDVEFLFESSVLFLRMKQKLRDGICTCFPPLRSATRSGEVSTRFFSHPAGRLYAGEYRTRAWHEQAPHPVGDVRICAQKEGPPLDVAGGNAHLTEPKGSVQPHDNCSDLFHRPPDISASQDQDGCIVKEVL